MNTSAFHNINSSTSFKWYKFTLRVYLVCTSTRGSLKKKEIIRGEYDKQVQMITGDPLKKKDMLIDEKGKLVGT